MTDEIVSLFALMDTHLSRTKLNDEDDATNTTFGTSNILLPTPPGPRLVIPKFFSGNSPMKDFLAEQISNTLKAKEKRKQEEEDLRKVEEEMRLLKIRAKEKLRLDEEMRKLKLEDDQEYLIDLTAAIIPQAKLNQTKSQPPLNSGPSKIDPGLKTGSNQVHAKTHLRFDKETCLYKPWDPTLPCSTDMSHILKSNVRQGKCSKLGKVLCSRVRRFYSLSVPYVMERFDTSNIVSFDFKTKSPGDIYKEHLANQRKPKMSTRCTFDIMDFI